MHFYPDIFRFWILYVFSPVFKHTCHKFLLRILTCASVWTRPGPPAHLDRVHPSCSAACFPLSPSELCPGVCVTVGNGLWYHTPTVHLSSESRHHCNPNVKIYHSCWDEWRCLAHPFPSLLFLFPAMEVNGRRTGRSPYSCGTRSAATGWETTSTSTCTSALRRVGTGGSTRRMKSPVTVRNPPVSVWFADAVKVVVPSVGQNASVNEDAGCSFPSQLSESNLQAATEHSGTSKRMTLSHQLFEPRDFGH